MEEEIFTKRIDDLVNAFNRLVSPISELIAYSRVSQEIIRKTGRMMLVQTVLAVAVLAMLVAMGWIVMRAWTDVAAAQDKLSEIAKLVAEQQEKSAATYDYLVKKFPEDLAEISIVQAQPAAAQVVFDKVEPIPDPDGKRAAKSIERRETMLKNAIELVKKEKERANGGSAEQSM